MVKLPAAIYAMLLLAGCAAPGRSVTCAGGMGSSMRIFELYFGRAVAGRGDVTETEWQTFRDEVITANLPAGYTVLDGTGAWMTPSTHATITETTKILIVATPDAPASLAAIERLRTAYKTMFNQQSVGMTNHSGCGSFDP